MSIEENIPISNGNEEETPKKISTPTAEQISASTEIEELTGLEGKIDLNQVFPEEETDLNELFPDLEMKSLLKKVQKNKKDLNTMRDRFSDGI